MTWVAWRLQRTETLIAAGMLALIACLLVPTGIEIANAYHQDGVASCVAVNLSPTCAQAIGDFTSHYGYLSNLVTLFTLVPGIIGVLLAAPFVLDLEHGTYRLAWTQSITRRRWLAGKLGIAVPVALVAALVLTLLMTWWRAPFVHLNGRLEGQSFDFEGTVVFGYTLFALGLSAAVGAVWRKAVPALIVAFGGYFAARILVDGWLRQHLISPSSITWAASKLGPNLSHAWVLNEGSSTKAGKFIGAHFGGGPGTQRPHRRPTLRAGRAADQRVPQPQGQLHPRRLHPGKPFLGAARSRDRALRRDRAAADRLRGLVDARTDGMNTNR